MSVYGSDSAISTATDNMAEISLDTTQVKGSIKRMSSFRERFETPLWEVLWSITDKIHHKRLIPNKRRSQRNEVAKQAMFQRGRPNFHWENPRLEMLRTISFLPKVNQGPMAPNNFI